MHHDIKGFGVQIHPTGGKVYVAQARGPNGQKRVTVGRHPLIGAEQARQRAALIIRRIKAGEEPVPLPLAAKFAGGPTVADLARRYLEEHVAVRCKPKTARTTRSVVNRHIVPALGRLPLAAVERQHVMELHESLCETPAMANMTVKTLTHMYALARGWDMAPEDCHPSRSIPMNPKRKLERFLTDAEFTRLGQVLDEVSGNGSRVSAGAVATIRLLMLTGCRRNEILTLCWEHVDLDAAEIHLADGKTGARTVHLSQSAARVLAALPRTPGNPWVIPGNKPGRHMTDIDAAWETIRALAGLHDVRIHDIRHSFASRATGARRGPADHRPTPRSPPGRNHRALCAPRARLCQGIRLADRRQPRPRRPVEDTIPVTLAAFMLDLPTWAVRSGEGPPIGWGTAEHWMRMQASYEFAQTPRDRLPQNGARARCTHDTVLRLRGRTGSWHGCPVHRWVSLIHSSA